MLQQNFLVSDALRCFSQVFPLEKWEERLIVCLPFQGNAERLPEQQERGNQSREWRVRFGSPEPRAVLTQCMEDGVGDVGTARNAQGLEAVTATADCDETLVCDLLLGGGGVFKISH